MNAILTATTSANLNFGTAISPSVGSVTIATGAAPSATGQTLGAISLSHNSDFSTAVTSAPTYLQQGADQLPVTFACAYSTSATGAIVAGSGAACSAMPNRTVTTLGTTQTTVLQVGGTLTVPAGVAPGTYTAPSAISFLFTAITT
ncbi:MAG TPA: DUF4402 domain-containing protein [Longimicrobiales bacterium]